MGWQAGLADRRQVGVSWPRQLGLSAETGEGLQVLEDVFRTGVVGGCIQQEAHGREDSAPAGLQQALGAISADVFHCCQPPIVTAAGAGALAGGLARVVNQK